MFSVSVPVGGLYDIEHDHHWDTVKEHPWRTPEDLDDFDRLRFDAKVLIAVAAGEASNPDKPPFFLDMPFEEMDGAAQIVQDVYDRMSTGYPVHDVNHYLNQPVRLRGLMIYHGEFAGDTVEDIREFSKRLTELGVEHEYLEVPKGYCNLEYTPVLKYMSDRLVLR